jgi:hypothetical protein
MFVPAEPCLQCSRPSAVPSIRRIFLGAHSCCVCVPDEEKRLIHLQRGVHLFDTLTGLAASQCKYCASELVSCAGGAAWCTARLLPGCTCTYSSCQPARRLCAPWHPGYALLVWCSLSCLQQQLTKQYIAVHVQQRPLAGAALVDSSTYSNSADFNLQFRKPYSQTLQSHVVDCGHCTPPTAQDTQSSSSSDNATRLRLLLPLLVLLPFPAHDNCARAYQNASDARQLRVCRTNVCWLQTTRMGTLVAAWTCCRVALPQTTSRQGLENDQRQRRDSRTTQGAAVKTTPTTTTAQHIVRRARR